jgi:hypothetical protein
MKPIMFSKHALDQMRDRGAIKTEVEAAIQSGEQIPAKKGRLAFRKNFPFRNRWQGRYYEMKQVTPVIVEESDRLTVVTVYVFYFGGER